MSRFLEKNRKVRILLAEDNVINQRVVLKILNKFDYRALIVANGNEAVKSFEIRHSDGNHSHL